MLAVANADGSTRDGSLLDEIVREGARRTARPLQVGPTLHVDTTRPVDMQAVIAWIQKPEHRSHTDHGLGSSVHRS
ncbi:hypothetical protein [Kitasatospora sp. NPDC056531]|uniref:hypothetical protein n=1 Tax=Kitasatospora sp. NPDC056531 TaxID=3345856 RepID=UPI0036CF246B